MQPKEISANSTPNVTVITPIHNSAPWLDETIMSVRNQTHGDFTYLLLDDSSTDNSLEIARQHAAKDERLCVLPVQFRSVSNTRQAGVDLSNTEFVAFLDGDDRWRPDFLKRGP
jgi:glycosyltransferase involved in cell wall biosynthesis